jgi:hypothetical protein
VLQGYTLSTKSQCTLLNLKRKLNCGAVVMEYTQDEYCDMRVNSRYIVLADVIQTQRLRAA